MRVRFQADADLNHTIVLAVLRREPGLDFQTSAAGRLAGLADPDVLALCAREGRILVSHDQKTMPHHFAQFIQSGTSPGLLIVPQRLPTANVVEELLLIWRATDTVEWTNRVCYLPL